MHRQLRSTRTYLIAVGVLALAAAGGGIAGASTASSRVLPAAADDSGTDRPIVGRALDRASRAALASTGEGNVTGTEVGDEESRYEVEVTLPDGRQVDVQLDEGFAVVGTSADGSGDDDAGEGR